MSEATTDRSVPLSGRQKTRRSLLEAGLELLAAENTDVAVLTITRIAGVGQGTFYNHFEDKSAFFRESVEYGVGLVAHVVDELASSEDDHARSFGQSFRLLAGMHREVPELSRALILRANAVYSLAEGFVARLRREIVDGVEQGRFHCESIEGVVGTVIGSAMMLGQRLHDHPETDAAEAAREIVVDLLVMLGIPRGEARDTSREPLPVGSVPVDLPGRRHGAAGD